MKKTTLWICLGALTVALSGCLTAPGGAGVPSHYYRLEAKGAPTVADTTHRAPVLIKVTLADALRSPRIAYARSAYEVSYQEGARWAETLDIGVARVIREGLKASWPHVEAAPLAAPFAPQWRVEVALDEAWGTSKGAVKLKARWVILNSKGERVDNDEKTFEQKGWDKGDYEEFAARLSGLALELAKEINSSLSSLDESSKKL